MITLSAATSWAVGAGYDKDRLLFGQTMLIAPANIEVKHGKQVFASINSSEGLTSKLASIIFK